MTAKSELGRSALIPTQISVSENSRFSKFSDFSSKRWGILAITIGSLILVVVGTFGTLGLLQSHQLLTLPHSLQWLTMNSSLGLVITGAILGGGLISFGVIRLPCRPSKQNAASDPVQIPDRSPDPIYLSSRKEVSNQSQVSTNTTTSVPIQKEDWKSIDDETLKGIGNILASPYTKRRLSQMNAEAEFAQRQSPRRAAPNTPPASPKNLISVIPSFLAQNGFSSDFQRLGIEGDRLAKFKKLKKNNFLIFGSPNAPTPKNIYIILQTAEKVLYCSSYLDSNEARKMRQALIDGGYFHKAPARNKKAVSLSELTPYKNPEGLDVETAKHFGNHFLSIDKSPSLFSNLPSEHYFFDDRDKEKTFIVIKDGDGELFCTKFITPMQLLNLTFDLGGEMINFTQCKHLEGYQ